MTNFSFEFSYKIFTEDASLLFLYHGAKKSKMTKNSNQGGPALNNLHAYHGRVGGNQLPPVNLLLPRMTGRNMRPHVIYFTNWSPLRLRWAHYFRMRDHGSSLFSAVNHLHIYKSLPQIFQFFPGDLVMIFQSLVMILPRFFDFERP